MRTFSGDGGAIDVSSDGTTLHVVSTRPNDRYTADVRDGSGQRIEVRFSSRWHRTTIRVELRNGAMTPVVTESDSGSSTSPPRSRRRRPAPAAATVRAATAAGGAQRRRRARPRRLTAIPSTLSGIRPTTGTPA